MVAVCCVFIQFNEVCVDSNSTSTMDLCFEVLKIPKSSTRFQQQRQRDKVVIQSQQQKQRQHVQQSISSLLDNILHMFHPR